MGGAHKYLSLFPTPLAVLPRRIYLIQSSSVMFPFDSLEAVRLFTALPSTPASFTNITVYLELEAGNNDIYSVSYTHLRAHETLRYLVCRLLLEKKKK